LRQSHTRQYSLPTPLRSHRRKGDTQHRKVLDCAASVVRPWLAGRDREAGRRRGVRRRLEQRARAR
jgi:hypothetical protein